MPDSLTPVSSSTSNLTATTEASSSSPAPEPLMCIAPEPELDPGSAELVRRYEHGQGGSLGSEDPSPSSDSQGRSCTSAALRTVASCGATVVVATTSGGLGAIFTGLGCLASASDLIDCLAEARE